MAKRRCRQTGCMELSGRFKLSRRSEPPRRSEPSRCSELAASASSPVGVILGRSVVSQSLNARRSVWKVVVGARAVTRPLTGDNCAVRAHCRELRRLNRCLSITACRRNPSMLSCNVRDNDTYCPASSESAQ